MGRSFKSRKFIYLFIFIFVVSVISLCSIYLNPTLSGEIPVLTHSSPQPVETKPAKETYKWYGDPGDPKYISIPTISAEGFIQKAGIDQNNQIAAPSNIHIAGWFIKSSKPGEQGLSIIDGHVTGRVNNGIFKNLESLKQGAFFSVTLGNGSVKKYQVVNLVTVPVDKSVDALFSQDPSIKSQLNLITCAGKYDESIKGYTDRTIVYSKLVN